MREDIIQNLLRHSMYCLMSSNCNCYQRIRTFLKTDKISLNWAKKKVIKTFKFTKEAR